MMPNEGRLRLSKTEDGWSMKDGGKERKDKAVSWTIDCKA